MDYTTWYLVHYNTQDLQSQNFRKRLIESCFMAMPRDGSQSRLSAYIAGVGKSNFSSMRALNTKVNMKVCKM